MNIIAAGHFDSTFGISADTARTFLHLIGIFVWVGGQIVVALLMPLVKKLSGEAPKQVAKRFNKIAWPFFALAILTGLWGLGSEWGESTTEWKVWLFVKMVVVALSGVTAWLHISTSRSIDQEALAKLNEKTRKKLEKQATTTRAFFAGATLVLALVAVFLGIGLTDVEEKHSENDTPAAVE